MKFQPETLAGINNITHVDASGVRVNGTSWAIAIVVPWSGPVGPWEAQGVAAGPGVLTREHFDRLLASEPEVVLFGSGARLQFASPALLRGLMERRIGIETMDTAAACRTYSVLASEGRRVVAALLPAA